MSEHLNIKTFTEFKIGDLVKAFGLEGEIDEIDSFCDKIFVKYKDIGIRETYRISGKLCSWHKEPSLILVERPKKKVKKVMRNAIVESSTKPGKYWVTDSLFENIDEAKKAFGDGVVALTDHSQTFEVDDD